MLTDQFLVYQATIRGSGDVHVFAYHTNQQTFSIKQDTTGILASLRACQSRYNLSFEDVINPVFVLAHMGEHFV